MGLFRFCAISGVLISVFLGLVLYKLPPYLDQINFGNERGVLPSWHRDVPWGFQLSEIPDLSGKTIIVTGANSGLGFWTAYHLAQNNAKVIMAVRNTQKGDAAKEKILKDISTADLEVLALDLSDLSSVRDFAQTFRESYARVDSLILNAGLAGNPYTLSKQGLELQFAVNHLGHFYLTKLLWDKLAASSPSTVVVVSSAQHYNSDGLYHSVQTLNDESKYDGWAYYQHSKLCNVYFGQELHSKFRERGIDDVFVNMISPGLVYTGLGRHMPNFISTLVSMIAWQPEIASLTQIFAAVAPKIFEDRISGKYFHPIARQQTPSDQSKNLEKQKHLWTWSEELISKFESEN